ncbi:unnamed protein product, partial [Allacma fusca]
MSCINNNCIFYDLPRIYIHSYTSIYSRSVNSFPDTEIASKFFMLWRLQDEARSLTEVRHRFRVFQLHIESLQNSGQKHEEFIHCQRISWTVPLPSEKRHQVIIFPEAPTRVDESFRSEDVRVAPVLLIMMHSVQ